MDIDEMILMSRLAQKIAQNKAENLFDVVKYAVNNGVSISLGAKDNKDR